MKQIARIGLDIAKSVFQLHGVDSHGKPVCKKILSRGEVLTFFVSLPSCLGGIEACAGPHYWARELIKRGRDARLMAAQFVSPYRKNDANDAEAICEAVGRPNMRFVPVKSEEAQAVLAVHRARVLTVSERTALINQVRGLGPAKRSRPTADGHRGDWPYYGNGPGRQRRQRASLQERAAVCRLVGAHAPATLQRRQNPAWRHQQARGCGAAVAPELARSSP